MFFHSIKAGFINKYSRKAGCTLIYTYSVLLQHFSIEAGCTLINIIKINIILINIYSIEAGGIMYMMYYSKADCTLCFIRME